ncbi:MAG TPA: hypothetical protein PLB76_04170 [Anaerohalosphaeraceae bacterium]|nr:hypothetical protein [Anaerohalosphaeraceae bacterium]HQJ67240.1 hypothetical protein [Anaerohalosphaeraceae bacterium]
MGKWSRVCLIAWIGCLAGFAAGWPRPSALPEKGCWTLDVTYGHPVLVTVPQEGSAEPKRFWYMIISVVNLSSEEEVPFYPKFELLTDTFQVLPAGQGEMKGLFERVKAMHRGQYPFLESLDFTDNRIRRGKDNQRDFVIFWPDFDCRAKEIRFYLAGLSNETIAVEHPTLKEDGRPMQVYLQKTLELTYSIGADPHLRGQATLRFEGQDWVMR